MDFYVIEEVAEIQHDLKKIKVTGFNADYDVFKKALPHLVAETDFYRSHGFF